MKTSDVRVDIKQVATIELLHQSFEKQHAWHHNHPLCHATMQYLA